MKKVLVIVLCLMMMLQIAACGSAAPEQPQTGEPVENVEAADPAVGEKRALTLGAGSSSAVWYIIGGGIGNVINSKSEHFTLTTEAAAGSAENLRNLVEGNLDLGMVIGDVAGSFYASTGDYEGAGDDSLRSLITLPCSAMHIVVDADSDIQTVSDLKGKNVAVGTAGSGYEVFARAVINSAGLTYDDMKIQMINFNQMGEALQNGQIEAFLVPIQCPASAITELAISVDIRFIPIEQAVIDAVLANYSGYIQDVIPAGTYKNQDEEITTLSSQQFICCLRDSFTEEEMYNLMCEIFDNYDEWCGVHVKCAEMGETNISGLSVPVHVGALKFYTERGVEIPDNIIPPEAK